MRTDEARGYPEANIDILISLILPQTKRRHMYCNLSFYIQLHIPELYWYLSYLQLVESKLPIWATYIMFKAWEISTLTWIHSRVRNDREAVVLALFFHQSCLSRMVEAEVIILPNTHHTPCRMTQTNRVQWSISESETQTQWAKSLQKQSEGVRFC